MAIEFVMVTLCKNLHTPSNQHLDQEVLMNNNKMKDEGYMLPTIHSPFPNHVKLPISSGNVSLGCADGKWV